MDDDKSLGAKWTTTHHPLLAAGLRKAYDDAYRPMPPRRAFIGWRYKGKWYLHLRTAAALYRADCHRHFRPFRRRTHLPGDQP